MAADDSPRPGSEPAPAVGRPDSVDVSVIVPARNEAELLAGCLESLARLEATGLRIEVIVVDNGSADRTPAIARGHGVVVLGTSARTIAGVRNHGARAARGRLLAFVDADCTVDPAWLRNAVRHFDSPGTVAVGSYPASPASGASWLQEAWSFLAARGPGAPRTVGWLPAANLIVRASAFRTVGGFDASLETCEDTDLGYRLRRLGTVVDDQSVRVVHWREPRTLAEFFRREVWHGRNSYAGLRRGRLVWQEVPSLLCPIVCLLAAVGLVPGLLRVLAGRGWGPLGAAALGLMGPPVLYTARAVGLKGRAGAAPAFALIYLVYFLARGVAFGLWVARAGGLTATIPGAQRAEPGGRPTPVSRETSTT